MLDPKSLQYPSFNGMFLTCRSNPTIESYLNIRKRIGDLVMEYNTHVKADNAFLDNCNNKHDVGLNGEEILRDTASLHVRRATVINHQALVEKRELTRQEICTSKLNKMENANEEHTSKD